MRSAGAEHVGGFQVAKGAMLAIHHNFIFQTEDTSVKVLDFQGSAKQLLLLHDFQGKALCLDVSQEFLVLATTNCCICIWSIDGADIEPYGLTSGRKVVPDGDGEGEVTSIRCNSDCSKISFQLKCVSHPENEFNIFVYDTVIDKIFKYDFRSMGQELISHCWDGREPRLLACETVHVGKDSMVQQTASAKQCTTFFVSSESGILKLEHVDLDSKSALLGVDIPFIHLLVAQNPERDVLSFIIQNRTMRDFVDLEVVDTRTMAVLVEFNYSLAEGNVDDAYKAVNHITDKQIWQSIASVCVKTKRVEVALHCFAKMGWSSASAFVRASYNEPEVETRVAAVAIQLGLINEAQEFYIECNRYDLLNQLYQTCGMWEKAIEVASKHDHVHLKQTLHAHAKHLESAGNLKDAIHHFELSGTHRSEVPRMLYSVQHIEDLQNYVDKSGDPALQRWWGHFCEANDLLSQAIEYYIASRDISSLVRVYCFRKDFSMAASIALETSDGAAAFELARQFENSGDIRQAIKLFAKAGKPNYAAGLALKHNIDSELLALALQSTKGMMMLAAKYYEEKDKNEEAALLYHKVLSGNGSPQIGWQQCISDQGGDLERAINVCFHAQLYDALKATVDDLKEASDPALLAKCGDFLLQQKHADKAVQVYMAAKHFITALDLCLSEGVILTDKMADAMAPKPEEQKTEQAIILLHKVAEVFDKQGSYHLSCKKFTQAGNRVSAMKALLKSGDTQRIIFFANLSRQKQIYIIAANYLQNLDWHRDAQIMKTIIQMYTKAGEMESLASFYEACAQIEICEYRDYEKALGAMKEALKSLSKSPAATQTEDKVHALSKRISEVEIFVQARRMAKDNPTAMIQLCTELLLDISSSANSDDAAVQIGDLYALMIEFYYSQGNMEQAYQLIEKMRASNISLGPYIGLTVVQTIYQIQAVGIDLSEEDLGDAICEGIEEK
ncbi:unnamed protein product [Calypogeia fissa]